MFLKVQFARKIKSCASFLSVLIVYIDKAWSIETMVKEFMFRVSQSYGKTRPLLQRLFVFFRIITISFLVFTVGTTASRASIKADYLMFSSHPESKFASNSTLRTNITDQTSREAQVGNASPYVSSLSSLNIDSNGNANYQIPIKIPHTPSDLPINLALNYSSSGGASAYGFGWNLNIDPNSEIRIDSQWLNASDSFNDKCESETYFVGATRLLHSTEIDEKSECAPYKNYLSSEKIAEQSFKNEFHKKIDYERTNHGVRNEMGVTRFNLDHIKPSAQGRGTSITAVIRHGNSTQNYWWEVREDQTTKIYGRDDGARVKNHDGHIVKWLLQEIRVQERFEDEAIDYEDQPVKIYSLIYKFCDSQNKTCGRFTNNKGIISKHYLSRITGTRYSLRKAEPNTDSFTKENFDIQFNWSYLDNDARNDGLTNKQCTFPGGTERPDARFDSNLGEINNYDYALLGSIVLKNNLYGSIKPSTYKSYHFCYQEYKPTHATKLSKVLLRGANESNEISVDDELTVLNEFDYYDDLQVVNSDTGTKQAVWFESEKVFIDKVSATKAAQSPLSAFSTSTDKNQGGRFHIGLGFSTFKELSLSLSGTASGSKSESTSPLYDCDGDGNFDLVTDFNSGKCITNKKNKDTGEFGEFICDGDSAKCNEDVKVIIPPKGEGKGKSEGVTLGLMAPVINASIGLTRGKSTNHQFQLEANGDQYNDHRDKDGQVYFGLGDGEFTKNPWETRIPMSGGLANVESEIINILKDDANEECNSIAEDRAKKGLAGTDNRCKADRNAIWVETKQIKVDGKYTFTLEKTGAIKNHKFDSFGNSYEMAGEIRTAILIFNQKEAAVVGDPPVTKIVPCAGLVNTVVNTCNFTAEAGDQVFYVFSSEKFGGSVDFSISGKLAPKGSISHSLVPYTDWKYETTRFFDDKFVTTPSIAGRGLLEGEIRISGLPESPDDETNKSLRIELFKQSSVLNMTAAATGNQALDIALIEGVCKIGDGEFITADGVGEWVFKPRINDNSELTCDIKQEEPSPMQSFERNKEGNRVTSGFGIQVKREDGKPWPDEFRVNSDKFKFTIQELNIQEGGPESTRQQKLLNDMVAAFNVTSEFVDNEDPPPASIKEKIKKKLERENKGVQAPAKSACLSIFENNVPKDSFFTIKASVWRNIDTSKFEGVCFSKPWLVKSDDLKTNIRMVTRLKPDGGQEFRVPASVAYGNIKQVNAIDKIAFDPVNNRFLLPSLSFMKNSPTTGTWFDTSKSKTIEFSTDYYSLDNELLQTKKWAVTRDANDLSMTCKGAHKLIIESSIISDGESWTFESLFEQISTASYKGFLQECAVPLNKEIKMVEWSNFNERGDDDLSLSLINPIALSYQLQDGGELATLADDNKPIPQAKQTVGGIISEYLEPQELAKASSPNEAACINHSNIQPGKNGWDSQIFLTEETLDDSSLETLLSPTRCVNPASSNIAGVITKALKGGQPNSDDLLKPTVLSAKRRQLSKLLNDSVKPDKQDSALPSLSCKADVDKSIIFGLSGQDSDICLVRKFDKDNRLISRLAIGKEGNPEVTVIANCELAKASGIPSAIESACRQSGILGEQGPDTGEVAIDTSGDPTPMVTQNLSLPPQFSKNYGTNKSATKYSGSVSTTDSNNRTQLEQIRRGQFNDFIVNNQWFVANRAGQLIKKGAGENSFSKSESKSYGITGDFLPDNTPVSPFPTFGRSKSNPALRYENFNNDQFIDRIRDSKPGDSIVDVEFGHLTGWLSPVSIKKYTTLENINLTTTPGLFPSSRFSTEEQILGSINTGAYGITINGQLSENATDTKCSFVGSSTADGYCTKLFRPKKSYTVNLDNSGLSAIVTQEYSQIFSKEGKDRPYTKIKLRKGTDFETFPRPLYELNAEGFAERGDSRLLTKGFTKGFSASYAYGFPLVPTPIYITFGAGVNQSKNENETFSAFLDINADGFDDYVRCARWGCAYKKNRFGKTLLLKSVTNQTGPGSAQYVDYTRKYKDKESPTAMWKATVLASANYRQQTGNQLSLQFNEYQNHLYERGKKQSIGYGESHVLTIKDDELCVINALVDSTHQKIGKSKGEFSLATHLNYIGSSRQEIIEACDWSVQKTTYLSDPIRLHGPRKAAGLSARALYLSGLVETQTTSLKTAGVAQKENVDCFPIKTKAECFISDQNTNEYKVGILEPRSKASDEDDSVAAEVSTHIDDERLLKLYPEHALQISLSSTETRHFEKNATIDNNESISQCRANQFFYDSLGYLIKSIDHGVDCIDDFSNSIEDTHYDNVITRYSYTGMKGLGKETEDDNTYPYHQNIDQIIGSSNASCGDVDITGIVDAIAVFENTKTGNRLKRFRYDEYKCRSNFDFNNSEIEALIKNADYVNDESNRIGEVKKWLIEVSHEQGNQSTSFTDSINKANQVNDLFELLAQSFRARARNKLYKGILVKIGRGAPKKLNHILSKEINSLINEELDDQVVLPGQMLSRNIAVEERLNKAITSITKEGLKKGNNAPTLHLARYIYKYDPENLGLLGAINAPNGYTTNYQYSRDYPGYLINVSDNLEQTVDVSYDWRVGKINQRIGSAGEVYRLHYDDFGRVIGETNPKDFHLLRVLNQHAEFPDGASTRYSYCLPGVLGKQDNCDLPTSVVQTLYRNYEYAQTSSTGPITVTNFKDSTQGLQIALYTSGEKPWRTALKRAAPPGVEEREIGITINQRKFLDTAGRTTSEAFPVWCRPTSMPNNAGLDSLAADQVKSSFFSSKTPSHFELQVCEKTFEYQLLSPDRFSKNWHQYIKEDGHHNDKPNAFTFNEAKPRRTEHEYDLLDRRIGTHFPDSSQTKTLYALINSSEIAMPDLGLKTALLVADNIDKKLTHNLSMTDSRGYLFAKAKSTPVENLKNISSDNAWNIITNHIPKTNTNPDKDIWTTYVHNGLGELEQVNERYVTTAWQQGTTYFEYDIVGRNTLIDHPDMGERRFGYNDRNHPNIECTGLQQNGSYESVKVLKYELGSRPILIQFYESIANDNAALRNQGTHSRILKKVTNKEDLHGNKIVASSYAENKCTMEGFTESLSGQQKQSITYEYEWGQHQHESQRNIGSQRWENNTNFNASKLITETKIQELGDSRKILYRKRFAHDESGATISMFNDIAAPLYSLKGNQPGKNELIRASSQFTVTDNQGRPVEILSADGVEVKDRNQLFEGDWIENSLKPESFKQTISYDGQDERLATIAIQAGNNSPELIVESMLYDEQERQVRWGQANKNMTISQHYNPFTQNLESTVGSGRKIDDIGHEAWHLSYLEDREIYERSYEYETAPVITGTTPDPIAFAKSGNISAISLKQQNVGEKIDDDSPEDLKLTTRFEASYDHFSRLESGIGSHWIEDANRFVHPGFDKKSPNAGCYFQNYAFDDRNNLTQREHFVLDDFMRQQLFDNKTNINKAVKGKRLYLDRTEDVVWKLLNEKSVDDIEANLGNSEPSDYEFLGFKHDDIVDFGTVQQFCSELNKDSSNWERFKNRTKQYQIAPVGAFDDGKNEDGIVHKYGPWDKKDKGYDRWSYPDHSQHPYTIQKTRRDLLPHLGSVNYNFEYKTGLHRPSALNTNLKIDSQFSEAKEHLNVAYDARGQQKKH